MLLEKDLETARRCFSWLESNRSDLCKAWQDEFSLAVGRKILGLVHLTLEVKGSNRLIP